MLKGECTIYKNHGKFLIYIPKQIALDSQFPFSGTTTAQIELKEGSIIISGDGK